MNNRQIVLVDPSGLLPLFERARTALAEAKSLDEVKQIRDQAQAVALYLHQQRAGLAMQNDAAEIKLRAERRLGEMLQETEKNPGVQMSGSNIVLPPKELPKLEDLGISRIQSHRWQAIASIPEPSFEQVIQERKANQSEITTATMLRVAYTLKRNGKETPPFPNGQVSRYRVIYADPPWKYGNTMPHYFAEQADHYELMDLEEVCALPVQDIVEEDAVLFLWATSPALEEAFSVIRAWGFRYKASFIWDKVKHNMGHYNSVRHELLLVATRGACLPDVPKLYDSVVTEERTEHSGKPQAFYEIIETLYPVGKRLELFARSQHEGWDAYGNEL